jgi:outer membrane protein assembly factor BamB
MGRHHRALAGVLVVLAVLGSSGRAQTPSDWPQWRGRNRDGVITAFSEPRAWPERLTRQWTAEVGLGYATPLLVGDRLFMFSRQGDDEVMSALDAANGSVLWRSAYPAPFTMQSAAARHGPGPKSTPTYANGRVFSIGMTGVVSAFDAPSGKLLWRKPAPGIMTLYTSHAFSPLVDRGMVVFHVGGHGQGALTAYDEATGDVRWRWDGDGPAYGSPIVAELGGTRQIVTFTQDKLVGVDAATGALLWERPYTTPGTQNSITPILYGETLIVSGNQQPVVAFTVERSGDRFVTEDVWENADASMRMSNGVIAGDVLFGLSTRASGQYFAIDARSGKTIWTSEGRQAGNAAISRWGDLVFSLEDDGELLVLRGVAAGFDPLRRYRLAESPTWAQPVIAGERLFVKDESSLALWTLN